MADIGRLCGACGIRCMFGFFAASVKGRSHFRTHVDPSGMDGLGRLTQRQRGKRSNAETTTTFTRGGRGGSGATRRRLRQSHAEDAGEAEQRGDDYDNLTRRTRRPRKPRGRPGAAVPAPRYTSPNFLNFTTQKFASPRPNTFVPSVQLLRVLRVL